MRQIFERNDVDIVGAAGQEGAEQLPSSSSTMAPASAVDRPCCRRIARTAVRS
jgi:hypothetical protein